MTKVAAAVLVCLAPIAYLTVVNAAGQRLVYVPLVVLAVATVLFLVGRTPASAPVAVGGPARPGLPGHTGPMERPQGPQRASRPRAYLGQQSMSAPILAAGFVGVQVALLLGLDVVAPALVGFLLIVMALATVLVVVAGDPEEAEQTATSQALLPVAAIGGVILQFAWVTGTMAGRTGAACPVLALLSLIAAALVYGISVWMVRASIWRVVLVAPLLWLLFPIFLADAAVYVIDDIVGMWSLHRYNASEVWVGSLIVVTMASAIILSLWVGASTQRRPILISGAIFLALTGLLGLNLRSMVPDYPDERHLSFHEREDVNEAATAFNRQLAGDQARGLRVNERFLWGLNECDAWNRQLARDKAAGRRLTDVFATRSDVQTGPFDCPPPPGVAGGIHRCTHGYKLCVVVSRDGYFAVQRRHCWQQYGKDLLDTLPFAREEYLTPEPWNDPAATPPIL